MKAEDLRISIMQEKKPGLGEDSEPINIHIDELVVIGVFDGMGGAGGAECKSAYGDNHTKAYVGSRIVRDAIDALIRAEPQLVSYDDFKKRIKDAIIDRYAQEKEKYPSVSKGGLRSALIKEYPTTLAITSVYKSNDNYIIDSYWAGDSRNYLWTSQGLFQLSIDNLKGNLDPLQNLHEDAPMSNCVQADGPFTIHHQKIQELKDSEKFIVFSATDGCFGYYPSPMDFERILSKTLSNANSLEEWKKQLSKCFALVTADDFSISLAAFGYDNFKEIKKRSSKSNIQPYIYQRDKYERELKKLRKQEETVSALGDKLSETIDNLWPSYKKSYLKYMENYEER